jgi:hypothetical protein
MPHLYRLHRIFFGCKEMDGVGLVNPQLFGFHFSFPSYFPFIVCLFTIDLSLRLDMCSGNLLRVLPGYLMAGLKLF